MLTIRRISSAFVACAFLVVAAGQVRGQRDSVAINARLAERIDSAADQFLRTAPSVGLSVAVVRGADTLVLRGYGQSDRELHRPVDRASVFRIASMTKQFTAAAILHLVEQRRLTLTDTVGKFLPRYRKWSGLTIHELLGHTSGLAPFNLSPKWVVRRAEPLAADTILQIIADDSLDFRPGTRFEYSNTGYLVLGRIVELVAGVPLADYWRREFFAPLRLSSARVCDAQPTVADDDAQGYESSPAGAVPVRPTSIASFGGAGSLCMNGPDLLRWRTALSEGRVLSPSVVSQMTHSDTLADGRHTGFGWGVYPRGIAGHPGIGHGGDIDGFSGDEAWVPGDSIRIVVLTNTFMSQPGRLVEAIARIVRGLPPATAMFAVGADLRAAVAGQYALALPNGATLRIVLWESGDQLLAQVQSPGQQSFPLLLRPDGDFMTPLSAAIRIHVDVENGRGVRLNLIQNGVTIRGQRVPPGTR